MKIVALISRLLLALIFVTFGLNGFIHFLPDGPAPTGLAGQFMGALMAPHYLAFVFAIQLVCGILFLINRFVPFALTAIAPVIVNILLFHALMNPSGILPGAVAAILWFIVAYRARFAFAGLFQSRIQG
jgi:putative oxidoreductase